MGDNKDITEFEEKLLEAVRKAKFLGEAFSAKPFLEYVRQIMPPTCTTNERKFLDRVREIGKWETFMKGTGIKLNKDSKIMQRDFTELNLKELVE